MHTATTKPAAAVAVLLVSRASHTDTSSIESSEPSEIISCSTCQSQAPWRANVRAWGWRNAGEGRHSADGAGADAAAADPGARARDARRLW
eukprot:3803487-Prymnesium_polylepis.1